MGLSTSGLASTAIALALLAGEPRRTYELDKAASKRLKADPDFIDKLDIKFRFESNIVWEEGCFGGDTSPPRREGFPKPPRVPKRSRRVDIESLCASCGPR